MFNLRQLIIQYYSKYGDGHMVIIQYYSKYGDGQYYSKYGDGIRKSPCLLPWQVWFSGLNVVLCTKRSLV